ncbi:hypothetical protein, partial [Salmonella enterica]|uniref:hypothetical protein n=1 Tax=Salmonella enterica TaxID=28901 RepID=UPI003D2E658E
TAPSNDNFNSQNPSLRKAWISPSKYSNRKNLGKSLYFNEDAGGYFSNCHTQSMSYLQKHQDQRNSPAKSSPSLIKAAGAKKWEEDQELEEDFVEVK